LGIYLTIYLKGDFMACKTKKPTVKPMTKPIKKKK
jgi:hypothetical protein